MPSSRRRASARAALALVAAALTLLGASSATQAATNPISISVKVGYSGFVKAQQWMPVTIDLTNAGPGVDGTLEVTSDAGTTPSCSIAGALLSVWSTAATAAMSEISPTAVLMLPPR